MKKICSALIPLLALIIGNTVAAAEVPVPPQYSAFNLAVVDTVEAFERDRLIAELVGGLEGKEEEVAPLIQEPLNCLYLGNSLVAGLESVSASEDKFICKVGISLRELNKTFLPKAVETDKNTVLIEMGSNELGVYSAKEFIEAYTQTVNSFGCTVYCLSIPPVNERKSKYAPRVNNANVQLYNSYIQIVCEQTGATYIDCSEFFGDTLKAAWTGDGLHLKTSVYEQWLGWIQTKLPEGTDCAG